MKTLLYIIVNSIYFFLALSVFLGYFALENYSYIISDNSGQITSLGKVILIIAFVIAIVMSVIIGIFAYRNYGEVLSRSDNFRLSNVELMQNRMKHSLGIAIASFFTFILTVPSICMFVLSI